MTQGTNYFGKANKACFADIHITPGAYYTPNSLLVGNNSAAVLLYKAWTLEYIAKMSHKNAVTYIPFFPVT